MALPGAAWVRLFPVHPRLKTTVANNDALGHCYLMTDDLQQSYAAYQNAISYLADRRVRGHTYLKHTAHESNVY